MDINESTNTPVPAEAVMSGTGVGDGAQNPIQPRRTYMFQVMEDSEKLRESQTEAERSPIVGMTCLFLLVLLAFFHSTCTHARTHELCNYPY